MIRASRRLLPHPILTLVLALVWVLLQNEITAGMIVFGLILGVIIPYMTSVWWPDRPKAFHLGRMIPYMLIVMWDIIVANIQVAWIVLSVPNAKLKSAWIIVPLELTQPEAIENIHRQYLEAGADIIDSGVVEYAEYYRVWVTMDNDTSGNTTATVTLYPAWRADFDIWLADVGMAPSAKHRFSRIDKMDGFIPGNCRLRYRNRLSLFCQVRCRSVCIQR
ncbi:hypothetical protein LCGC14_2168970, partial [marine sediment metagenome]